MRLLTLCLTLIVLVLQTHSLSETSAQEELLTQAPTEYRMFGVVKDEQGEPLSNATAFLVTLPTEPFGILQYLLQEPPTSSAECDQGGAFDIRITGSDARWNAVNERTEHLLIIQAPDFETSITKFQRERMLVDFPMDVSVKPCPAWKLKAINQDGSAVSGVQIKLAQVSGNKLPLKLDVLKAARHLGDGVFQMEGVARENLEGVYLSSDSNWNFRLPLTSLDGMPVVQLPKTGTVEGKFELPENVKPSELAGKKVIITGGGLFQRNETVLTPLSWSMHSLDDSAKASSDNVVFGAVSFGLADRSSVTYCGSIKDLAVAASLTPENSPLEITSKLYESKEIKIRFVDGDGNAITSIHTSPFGASGKTAPDGSVAIRVPVDEKPSGQLFPFDATGQYQVSDPFGVWLHRIKMVSGEPEPIEMTRSRTVRGRVTDEQGQIVAGAKVDYTIQSERFTITKSVLSNQSGDFEVNGLPADTTVALKASFGNQSTPSDANISVTSGHSEEVSIPVVTQPVASIAGTVIDQSGIPVPGANIKLSVANASQAEGYRSEELRAVLMIPDFPGVSSDENGRFEYSPTTQFKERIQVLVTADGYRDLRFPFIAGALKEVGEETIELGKFSLFKLPTLTNTTVSIKDVSSKQPVKDARIVFLGIDSEKQIATSDENGIAKLQLLDTRQLVAVKAKGYGLKLAVLENIESKIELSLELQSDKPKNIAWLEKDWKPFHEQAKKLLAKLEVPKPKESTYYRQSMYFKSQLHADFDAFRSTIAVPLAYQHQSTILLMNAPDIFLNAPEESVKTLMASPLPPQQKAALLSQCALLSEDEDSKEELYGEAIVKVGECSGTNAMIAVGQLAGMLVIDGKIDVAKELVGDAWDSAEELQAQLKSKEAKVLMAESRIFAPVLGLVDANAAIELTRLTAREVEIPGIIAQCLTYASLAGDQDLDAVCKESNVKFEATGLSQTLRSIDLSHAKYEPLAEWIQTHAETMPDSVAKVEAIMLAARHMPAGSERAKLLQLASSAREACRVSYFWDDPAKEILEELPKFESFTTAEFDELLFATLEHAPPKIDSYQLNMVFANLVRMVAVHDPQIAKQILDPAFENGAWLYGDPTWSAFDNNMLLKSYAWIDPELAAQKAVELSEKFSEDDQVRKLQLLTSVIDELNNIAVRKGMLSRPNR